MKTAFKMICALALLAGPAAAQTPNITGNTFQTGRTGQQVPGMVPMGLNASNVAVPAAGVAGSVSAGQAGGLAFGASTSTSPTYATGNSYPLSLDGFGSQRVQQQYNGTPVVPYSFGSDNSPSAQQVTVQQSALNPQACAALCSNLVAKAALGTLYDLQVSADSILSGADWYVMVFNAAALPADGAVTPIRCWRVLSGQVNFSAPTYNNPLFLNTGVVIGVSTTGCFSKTASVHAFIGASTK